LIIWRTLLNEDYYYLFRKTQTGFRLIQKKMVTLNDLKRVKAVILRHFTQSITTETSVCDKNAAERFYSFWQYNI